MEPDKSIEDQFSKLHPCWPVNMRIAILGGGPSGLSAAYALSKLGYNNVTVLEKYHTVSGMCESVDIDGKFYDLGGQVLAASSSPTIFNLAKEMGSELIEMDTHKLALIDSFTGKYKDIQVADDYVSVITLTLELQEKAKKSGRIGVHAVSDFASDLTPSLLSNHGLRSVPKSVAYGYTASGYGFVQDMPYAYLHEFTRTSMAGKIRRFKGGYMSFWQKISDSLPLRVRCNTEVVKIRRNSSGVKVDVKKSDDEIDNLEYDKLIISGSFPFTNGKTYRSPSVISTDTERMDFTDIENEMFAKVQTIDYYTTVMKIKGLEHLPVGFFYFGEFMDDPETIGNPVAMQRFYSDTNVFLFWSYGNSANIMGQEVTNLASEAVRRMGGEVEEIVLQRRFKYFPHVGTQDIKEGFYEKIETEIQSQNNTYYIGGLMAFELTERNSTYAMALVRKHFASDDAKPRFPYVKRLLQLKSECWDKPPQKLPESEGVKFPDLQSLDCYLKHWGTHNTIQNKILYTWLNDDGVVINQRTYRELNANASCIAEKLLSSNKPAIRPGERVLLVHIPGLDFIDAFFGCLRARVLPVPVLPPDPLQRGGQALLKIENIAKACNAVAILSTVGYHSAVRAGFVKNLLPLNRNGNSSGKWPNLPWLHTDSWVRSSKGYSGTFSSETPRPGDLCFLQFTSGSTGDAKGVMITHGGLVHNVKWMRRQYKSTSKTVLISWLPQYHDMGLIGGLFTSLVSGGTAVLFSPMSFIKNPLLWLQTISKYKGTHSAGPNFAFELVIRRMELDRKKERSYDLSSMVFLMVAAEPVRPKTLRRFIELTGPYGLSQYAMAPGYGLAENCVFVSCAYGEEKPILVDWQGRVSCGYVAPGNADLDVKIINPQTGEENEESGKEGEIWISSPSAGVGYWGREELSLSTFKNKLERRIYTRTGDLGRVIDGNLFITGRIKDLIIVAGRNIYSADVEKTVETSSDILRPGCCAVIGVSEEILSTKGISISDTSDQIGLVVVAEVRDGKPVTIDVVDQIKAKVAEEHGVTLAAVKLIKPRTISKTTSGKIKRFECLQQFTDETLNLVPVPKRMLTRSNTTGTCRYGNTPRAHMKITIPPQDFRQSYVEIVEFLKKLISEQTGVHVGKISTSANLTTYGIDSIGVVRAAQKLSDFLNVPVGAVDIFTATSIEDLASFSESLVMKSNPQQMRKNPQVEIETEIFEPQEVSTSHQLGIISLQFLSLIYISVLLILPAFLAISGYVKLQHATRSLTKLTPLTPYIISLISAPLAWVACIFATCGSISIFGNSFLQPNYALTPNTSIWSLEYVKWWALYKAQGVSSTVLAVHLRGTVLLNCWFQMFGAKIGSSVVLDTVDITDPALVSIGDGAVIAEGVLVQSHEVKNGVLSFRPVRIGKSCAIGPYAVIQKGSVLGDGNEGTALQVTEEGKFFKSNKPSSIQKIADLPKDTEESQSQAIYHLIGVYGIGFISTLSAAISYFTYIMLSQKTPSIEHFMFLCIAAAFHWLPFTITAYAIVIGTTTPLNTSTFSFSLAVAYFAHGLILILLTSLTSYSLSKNGTPLKMWFRHRLTVACHLRFSKLLSGTEAFCIYLRLLGAKIGKFCSIRAINPILEPKLVKIGDGVHLGDFSRIITGFYSSKGFTSGKVEVQENSVVGSQSVVLPGSTIQRGVILGAISSAPMNSTLKSGGVYIGSQTPIMIKNTMHELDERIEEMDTKYKKIVGNLAANLAATTLKVRTRYFHRIGVSGKGVLRIYNEIKGFPDHEIFQCGKTYPIIVRHSNSLSADDDARIDARGAAVRILSDESIPLLDLTLKTGNAFYARTVSDFATWLVCGLPAREEHVKRAPHIRDAVWTSLRKPDTFTELHYFSNICRLFRFKKGQEMYVKFKLRPFDENITEDSGKIEPKGILPPETGAIPRENDDKRPLLFLADDFQRRVSSFEGVRYVFQLQFRSVPENEGEQDIALDCTKPWDPAKFPLVDVGEVFINENLTKEQTEELQFNPFLRSNEVDVIRATSANQSASIDHGRSLVYEICQHLRNNEPLSESWRAFIEQSDVKVDLSGCPMAAMLHKVDSDLRKVTLARTWYQTSWAILGQPLLQTFLPYFMLAYVISTPLNWMFYARNSLNYPLQWLLPLFWVLSGIFAGLACVLAKWVLVGKKKDGGTALLWSKSVHMDTIWQAFKTIVGEYFVEMTSGSIFFAIWMKLMGSEIDLSGGVYVDSMGAVLNPEMVEIERGGCIGREALLFGHIYEGEGGKVKFGKISIREGGFVGSRAVAMPGAIVEDGGILGALALAMKEEIVRTKSHH